jgi:GNAT superfamily N-acetyltransferase
VQVRPYSAQAEGAVLEFARSVSAEDRNFLKEDAADPGVLHAWSNPSSVQRFLAWSDDKVDGYVALHPLRGWCDHVAEMRVLVASEARGHGIGQLLVHQAIAAAVQSGIAKVVTEVIAEHDQTVGMLQANGFVPEALLVDHVRDRTGHLRDLLVMTCRTDEMVDQLTVVGFEEALDLGV